MGGAGPEREGIYAVSASDVRKDKKAKEKAPLFLHGIEPQGHKWSCPLCPCWGAGGEVSGPLWTVLSPQEQALMCPLSLSAAFPGKEDMAKAQVTLRTLLSVQVGVREGVFILSDLCMFIYWGHNVYLKPTSVNFLSD